MCQSQEVISDPKSSPKLSPKVNKEMVASPLPPELVEPNDAMFVSGMVPTATGQKSHSQSIPETLPSTKSPPIKSPPLKKYEYEDFEYLKIVGRGYFGKVVCLTVCINPSIMQVL